MWHRVSVRADQVPRIDADWLQGERERLPRSAFESEYFCMFTEATGAVFSDADIEAMFDESIEKWTF